MFKSSVLGFTLVSSCCFLSLAHAATTAPQPLFDAQGIDMVYPSVYGSSLVYTQRINRNFQVIQLNKNNLSQLSQHIESQQGKNIVRDGFALADGTIGYTSNRLGLFTPWLADGKTQITLANGVFNSILLPNHLHASSDAKFWVFDATLEPTRKARVENQMADANVHSELLGQSWRAYHEAYWAVKSNYPSTKAGVNNKFNVPDLFVFNQTDQTLKQLGDGFSGKISPDGQSIVFVRDDNGNFDIWLQNIDGSGLTQLTNSPFADLDPAWNTDGSKIAFVSNRDANGAVLDTSIYTLDVKTKAVTRITAGTQVVDGGPAWMDHHTIIFHSNRDPQGTPSQTTKFWSLWTAHVQ